MRPGRAQRTLDLLKSCLKMEDGALSSFSWLGGMVASEKFLHFEDVSNRTGREFAGRASARGFQ